MKKASWILLTVLGVAITLLSLVSAFHAYRTGDDFGIGSARVSTIAGGDAGLATALRAIRGTSASFGAAYGVLFLAVVLGPYRRGEVWAWNALLIAGLTQCVLVLLRIPILGTQLGVSAALISIGVLAVGLVLDVGRVTGSDGRRTSG
ncbi:MAG TPA: hypothetical protein PLF26_10630 [Blastocatellia bacterium]|nr:hypothetical protein [Blastocatellia bacterium]